MPGISGAGAILSGVMPFPTPHVPPFPTPTLVQPVAQLRQPYIVTLTNQVSRCNKLGSRRFLHMTSSTSVLILAILLQSVSCSCNLQTGFISADAIEMLFQSITLKGDLKLSNVAFWSIKQERYLLLSLYSSSTNSKYGHGISNFLQGDYGALTLRFVGFVLVCSPVWPWAGEM